VSVQVEKTLDLATCLALRHQVFVREQGVPVEEEEDAHDPTATHFLALADGRPVGTARIVVEGDTGKIGRVCVLKTHRGTGLGAALIRACLDDLRSAGIRRARLGAQLTATGFYQKLGFTVTSGTYDDAGIPHVDMERPL